MKKRRKIILISALCLFALAAAAAGLILFGRHQSETNVGEAREIRVVLDNNYPPYVFYDDAGNLQGILVDQWKLWEEETGIDVKLSAMDWSSALEVMKSGKRQ